MNSSSDNESGDAAASASSGASSGTGHGALVSGILGTAGLLVGGYAAYEASNTSSQVNTLSAQVAQNTAAIAALQATLATSAASTGYTTLPGGIILQWGSFQVPANSSQVIWNQTFAMPFPHACLNATATLQDPNYGSASSVTTGVGVWSLSKTTIGVTYKTSDTNTQNINIYWQAIGN